MSAEAYKRAPYFLIVSGVVLILLGTYLGIAVSATWSAIGIGSGLLMSAWGLRAFKLRLANKDPEPRATYDEYLDQTCELNVRFPGPHDRAS